MIMKHNPEWHHHRSIPLRGYGYTQAGSYFVTIVTPQRACTFDEMRLCEIGEIVGAGWTGLPDDCRKIELDESIVMPNHLHGTAIIVREPARRGEASAYPDASRSTGANAHASPLPR